MTARKQPKPEPALTELFAWVDDFKERSEHFDDATPAKVWDLILRMLALKFALEGSTASPEFREGATKNFRRFIRELQAWDSATRTGKKAKAGMA